MDGHTLLITALTVALVESVKAVWKQRTGAKPENTLTAAIAATIGFCLYLIDARWPEVFGETTSNAFLSALSLPGVYSALKGLLKPSGTDTDVPVIQPPVS